MTGEAAVKENTPNNKHHCSAKIAERGCRFLLRQVVHIPAITYRNSPPESLTRKIEPPSVSIQFPEHPNTLET